MTISGESKEACIAQAFAGSRWLRGYVRGKLAGDPVFSAAAKMIVHRPGAVVDLGCGLGLLGLWLRSNGWSDSYRGCDLGGWKIDAGRQAARRLAFGGMVLEEADMLQFQMDGAATVCAFDVLHYLTEANQKLFLRRLAGAARCGAVVLLRTGVRGCGWRTGATLLEEWWTRATGWIRGGAVAFPALDYVVGSFEESGCKVESRPLWGGTPFSSHWIEVSGKD